MKRFAIFALGMAAFTASAHEDEIVINQASELVEWCHSEAEARHVAKGLAPSNWTASYHEKDNVLYVDGGMRVSGGNVVVNCRIAKGARRKYATIQITGK